MKEYKIAEISSTNQEWVGKSYIDNEPPLEKTIPTGPFQLSTGKDQVDLLLFVPRNAFGKTIDALTGRYGYSHLAVDCGEIDVLTGRRVMIESTVASGVHYAFLEAYGARPFVRVPLQNTGINVQQFCECIHSKVGERFDKLEVITLGILNNPARQICSDVATVCLPEDMRQKIIRSHRGVVLHPLSAVRDELSGSKTRLFVSPNGFAEFLDVPRGNLIHTTDQLVEPHIQESDQEELISKLWKLADTVITRAWMTINERLAKS